MDQFPCHRSDSGCYTVSRLSLTMSPVKCHATLQTPFGGGRMSRRTPSGASSESEVDFKEMHVHTDSVKTVCPSIREMLEAVL